jgi:hypothetical protein
MVKTSVPDPDNPYVFGPPGSDPDPDPAPHPDPSIDKQKNEE